MPRRADKMNIWVEWWKIPNTTSGSHAQMSENKTIYKPDPKDIQRRFFDTRDKAGKYAQQKNTEGYYAAVKEDRSL
jgi:hypothetical protein